MANLTTPATISTTNTATTPCSVRLQQRTCDYAFCMCVAVIVYDVVSLYVVAIIVGVFQLALSVIKIFAGAVKVRMNCNNHTRYRNGRIRFCSSQELKQKT